MTTEVAMGQMVEDMQAIRKDIQFIKTHMFDPDTIMSIEEERRFQQSLEELKEGKTTSLADLKKELGL